MSFGSDEAAPAPEGVFLKSHSHPRAYGNFAKLLAKYVRSENAVKLSDAIHRMTGLPAANLSLRDRGLLKEGYFADIVVFDPARSKTTPRMKKPDQLATGVRDVLVNGQFALSDGKATGAHSGQFLRGRAWSGWKNGGCRASSKEWQWIHGNLPQYIISRTRCSRSARIMTAGVAPFHAIEISRLAHRLGATGRSIIHMEFGRPPTGAPRAAIARAHEVLDADALGYWEAPI
jgi:hypothetical protein